MYIIFGLLLVCRVLSQANITDTIRSWGYPVEVHYVLTPDNYILTVHHIPHGISGQLPTKGAVILQHGLTDSSAGWCMNPPDESLSYILADAGYDVWLGNNRGNGYSMANVNFGPGDPQFWDFSWDEMALYDFPSIISFVKSQTNSTKVSYIGHSEGTIQAFAGLIANPSVADNLKVFIALAPVAYVGNIGVELMQILSKLDADALLKLVGVKEFYLANILHELLPAVCFLDPKVCEYGGTFFYGRDNFMNASRFDVYTDFEPFPTSAKNIIHWSQGVRTSTFQRYDYGTQGNLQHYGQATPPPYDITKFPSQLPLALFTGGVDDLADPDDVQLLFSLLPTKPTVYNQPLYGHLDVLLGYNANLAIYPDLLAVLAKYA